MAMNENPENFSLPLDLDALDARLHQIDSTSAPGSPLEDLPPCRRLTSPIDFEDASRRGETMCYNTLLQKGGRPLYPIDLLDSVSRNTAMYSDILRPFSDYRWDEYEWQVFGPQLERWNKFQSYQSRCRRQREKTKGAYSFVHHVEALQRRLAELNLTYGIDPKWEADTQDKMTTWFEYVHFECYCVDEFVLDLEDLQPEHDKGFQKLVDDGLVPRDRDPEYMRSRECVAEEGRKEELAKSNYDRAKIKFDNLAASADADSEALESAREVMDIEYAEWQSFKYRNDRIEEFVISMFPLQTAKERLPKNEKVRQWALDQLPLVEAEMQQDSDTPKSQKRKSPVSGTERDPKRLREGSQEQSKYKAPKQGREQVPKQEKEGLEKKEFLATEKTDEGLVLGM